MKQESTGTHSNAGTQVARQTPRHVFAITERGEGLKSIWTRIGLAWNNRDGSITLRLDALPMSGIMQVRDPDERATLPSGAATSGGAL
jgi:hypothetical protein